MTQHFMPKGNNLSDQNKKVFLGGLSYTTTDETLRAFCGRFGTMTDCIVMRASDGKSRGFGFVTYEDTSTVDDFMRARPHTIDNRQIDAKRAMPREDQNNSEAHIKVTKLFVGGLRDGITEAILQEYFSRFGNINEVKIMNDREGKPRGFAFVTFDDYDPVDKVILEKPHYINNRILDVKKAIPKEKIQNKTSFPSKSGNQNQSDMNAEAHFNNNWNNQSQSQQSMTNFNSNIPYNNQNQPMNPAFMPPVPNYPNNSMNPFNIPPQQMNVGRQTPYDDYNNNLLASNRFENENHFGFAQGNPSRGGGPMRSNRGGAAPTRKDSGTNRSVFNGDRSAPYSMRGGLSNNRGRGRGRGRGQ